MDVSMPVALTNDAAAWLATIDFVHGCNAEISNIQMTDVTMQLNGNYQGTCPHCGNPFILTPPSSAAGS